MRHALPESNAMMRSIPSSLVARLGLVRRGGGLGICGLVCLAWLPAACADPPAPSPAPLPLEFGGPSQRIYVVNHGWHSGIVVPRAALPPGAVPEAAELPAGPFLEFGWGDREYYPSPRPTLGMALAAALTPSPAVMHLAALPAPPKAVWPDAEVLAFDLTEASFARLVAAIDADFERPAGGRAEAAAKGLYLDSLFYPAKGRFHLFNTCNTWSARHLAGAGLDVSPAGVITAEDLMSRLRALPSATPVEG